MVCSVSSTGRVDVGVVVPGIWTCILEGNVYAMWGSMKRRIWMELHVPPLCGGTSRLGCKCSLRTPWTSPPKHLPPPRLDSLLEVVWEINERIKGKRKDLILITSQPCPDAHCCPGVFPREATKLLPQLDLWSVRNLLPETEFRANDRILTFVIWCMQTWTLSLGSMVLFRKSKPSSRCIWKRHTLLAGRI